MEKNKDIGDFLPLTSVAFEIMIALADEDRHGYGIMLEVERRTGGTTNIRPGTLYRAISRMVETGWVEDAHNPAASDNDDERRHYYRLTTLGRRIVTAEAERLASAVASARAKQLLSRNA